MEIYLIYFGSFFFLMALGYVFGTSAEKKHYKSIIEREKQTISLPVTNIKNSYDKNRDIASASIVTGSVVISIDYFKRFLAGLKNIFGGNISSFETLVDRGRREAVLRMKEKAPHSDLIINLKVETSTIGKNIEKNSVDCVEVIAYGTAITYTK